MRRGQVSLLLRAHGESCIKVVQRLTPGFEKRLSPAGMLTMYGSLAGALALGEWLARREA
jgi:hypothetical protein